MTVVHCGVLTKVRVVIDPFDIVSVSVITANPVQCGVCDRTSSAIPNTMTKIPMNIIQSLIFIHLHAVGQRSVTMIEGSKERKTKGGKMLCM